MNGKTAIVTGGERGIGKGIVRAFLDRGMRVCIAGIDTESANRTLDELEAGDRVMFLETNVREEGQIRKAVRQTVETFGRLDVMVPNAGLPHPPHKPIEELTLEEWNDVIEINLTGVFLCAKHAFPELRKTKGSIVLIASTRALQSVPNNFAYTASKGGVLSLTHSLAMSGGPDIRVNCISPGWIYFGDPDKLDAEHHAQHAAGRVGNPMDIGNLAAYLVSEEAGFITGQNFIADGGMTRKMVYV